MTRDGGAGEGGGASARGRCWDAGGIGIAEAARAGHDGSSVGSAEVYGAVVHLPDGVEPGDRERVQHPPGRLPAGQDEVGAASRAASATATARASPCTGRAGG